MSSSAKIASLISGEHIGKEIDIVGVRDLKELQKHHLSFAYDISSVEVGDKNKLILLLNIKQKEEAIKRFSNIATMIFVPNVRMAFAKISKVFKTAEQIICSEKISFVVGKNCTIDSSAILGSGVVIGNNTIVGKNVVIHSNCTVGSDCVVKDNSVIYSGSVLYDRVKIGMDCKIHSNCVIGADGFGFELDREKMQWVKIEHLGGVNIGNCVEIGASSAVDKGAVTDTIVENGVKIDNLVQVGHNVVVGENTIIASACSIAGSVKIGKCSILAGRVAIEDGLELPDNGIYAACAIITKACLPIKQNTPYTSAMYAMPIRSWNRAYSSFTKLASFMRKTKVL
jgi:UDP-3-O-[3-hydroxymyristoyl] glucosamine N-acyltransferase